MAKTTPSTWSSKAPAAAFNPSPSASVIDAALERDQEAASAEWLAEWRTDLADFLDRALIDAAVDRGAPVTPPAHRVAIYHAFVDPSGRIIPIPDAMALSDRDKPSRILDCDPRAPPAVQPRRRRRGIRRTAQILPLRRRSLATDMRQNGRASSSGKNGINVSQTSESNKERDLPGRPCRY